MEGRGCIVVFTKPARPGRVKTRLIGELSAVQTAQLHQAFLDDLIERLAVGPYGLRLAWALDDEDPVPDHPLPSFRQVGTTLGDRLFHGLAEATADYEHVAAIGSDHPGLSAATVDDAFGRLNGGAQVVLGPASDGGYYLVAATRSSLDRALFANVDWSTSRVLEQTLEHCRRLGLSTQLLALGHDVDTPADLPRLLRHLRDHPESCPRTRELFAGWKSGALA